jgi:Flp pilus assembly protein TadD
VQRAVSLYEQGNVDAAIAEYKKGIKYDPTDSDTWYGLAELYRELGREKQALDTYATALTVIIHAPELRAPYADLLLANKQKSEAMKVLQKGIEIDPDASAELKAKLGDIALGVLDEPTTAPAPAPVESLASPTRAAPAATASASKTAKPKPRVNKRTKLCRRFCAESFRGLAPKPK